MSPGAARARFRALTRTAAAIAVGLALALAAPSGSQEHEPLLRAPAPVVPLRPERVGGLEAYDCARCHAEVAEEWARSAHGLAWLDEVYQDELAGKKRPDLCHGCHVPEPLLAGALAARPEPRDGARALGVHCESCHQDADGAVLGPRGTPVAAHPSRVSEHLTGPGSNALCAACHSTTIGPVIGVAKDVLPVLAERGLSCVGCHMAPLERSWATDAPPRTGRSHALQTPRDPAFLALAFRLEHEVLQGKSVLSLVNQAGHRVPGLVGRVLRFEAELLDAAGALLERQEMEVDERAFLPLDGRRELRFARAGASLRVRGWHTDPRADGPVAFLDERLQAD